mmetsp:Transcript_1773/g.5315  ORF Transcript_1773/g.5315 Transcript_1773/m.5315 type:complete len:437 (+) Transcript_1773:158-1468(+)
MARSSGSPRRVACAIMSRNWAQLTVPLPFDSISAKTCRIRARSSAIVSCFLSCLREGDVAWGMDREPMATGLSINRKSTQPFWSPLSPGLCSHGLGRLGRHVQSAAAMPLPSQPAGSSCNEDQGQTQTGGPPCAAASASPPRSCPLSPTNCRIRVSGAGSGRGVRPPGGLTRISEPSAACNVATPRNGTAASGMWLLYAATHAKHDRPLGLGPPPSSAPPPASAAPSSVAASSASPVGATKGMSSASACSGTDVWGREILARTRAPAPGTEAEKACSPESTGRNNAPPLSVRPTGFPSSCTATPARAAPQQRVATVTLTLASASACTLWPCRSATDMESSSAEPPRCKRTNSGSRPSQSATRVRSLATEAQLLCAARSFPPSGSWTAQALGSSSPISAGQLSSRRNSQPPMAAMRSARGVGSRARQAYSSYSQELS